jgi:hypothetical protein
MSKLVIQLPKPMPAANDCLPHAAMILGAARGVGLRPQPGMVSRLVIESQLDAWCLHRIDEDGGFVGDTWHPTRADAMQHAKREFGVDVPRASSP